MTLKSSFYLGALVAMCLKMAMQPVHADTPTTEALPGAAAWLRTEPRLPLWIVSSSAKCWRFDTWVARSPDEFARGLMFVRKLDDEGGMLFAMRSSREISMWMRNTFVSLDILFADASGKIIKIHESATPLSLEHISSDGLARAVLELPAGAVARRGIVTGDLLRHPHFGNSGCHDASIKNKDNN